MSIKKKNDIYVTTPIFYVNDSPHIGHLYSDLVADIIARFHALNGHIVRAQTGTDEHGQKVAKSAEKNGQKVIDFCNQVSSSFYELAVELNFCASYRKFDALKNFSLHSETMEEYVKEKKAVATVDKNVLFDGGKNFIRTVEGRDLKTGEITTDSVKNGRHVKAVLAFWKQLQEHDWIYSGKYEGWYAMRDEAFYAENEIVDGKAPTGADVVWHQEDAYFFRLSEFQDVIIDLCRNHDFIYPDDRKKEILSFVSGVCYDDVLAGKKQHGALKDLCVSRSSLDWGIPVQGDEKHKIYVWLDALINYISALSFPDADAVEYWNNAKKIHIIGKDILRFHAVYWPAFLIGYSVSRKSLSKLLRSDNGLDFSSLSLSVPDKIVAHGWWTNKGEKISKSLGNVIVPRMETRAIQSIFGTSFEESVDYFRYFLVSSINIGSDGDYNRDRVQGIIQSHLCNNIGNLFNRTLSIIKKNCPVEEFFSKKYKLDQKTKTFFVESVKDFDTENIQDLFKDFQALIDNFALFKVVKLASVIGTRTNHFIEEVAPWKIKSRDEDLFYGTMQVLFLQNIIIAQLLYPIIPTLIGDFFNYLKTGYDFRRVPHFSLDGADAELRNGEVEDCVIKMLNLYGPSDTVISDKNILNAEVPIFFKQAQK